MKGTCLLVATLGSLLASTWAAAAAAPHAVAGYAIADVNYGGSTGFGREYRNRLRGNWGVVDVDDCCNAAR